MANASEKMSTLVDTLIASALTAGVTLNDVQRTILYDTAAMWLAGQANVSVPLSANKPEFQQILTQMQYDLETSDAWRDANTAATGRTFLRFMASGVAFAGLAAERVVQERHHYTAKLPSAILASAMALGVRLSRKVPAGCTVSLERSGDGFLQLPKYTSFIIDEHRYFSRDAILFAEGDVTPVVANLYQGDTRYDSYVASGAANARYELGSNDWSLSELDVQLKVDGVEWLRTTKGMYKITSAQRAFSERTLPNGNIEVTTGSGNYGVLPSAGATIEFTYVSTLGAAVSNNAVDLPVTCVDVAGVLGVTTTVITGGIEPETPSFYKDNAPAMAARRESAVRRVDYEATALDYKGVKILDARFLGQQEIDPSRKALTNVAHVALLTAASLTGAPLNDAQWLAFQTYIANNGIDRVTLVRLDPTPVNINLGLEIGVLPNSNRSAIEAALISLYRSFYGPRRGALGRAFYSHDLTTLIREPTLFDPAISDRISYIKPDMDTPETIVIERLEWLKLNTLAIDVVYTSRDYTSRETGLLE